MEDIETKDEVQSKFLNLFIEHFSVSLFFIKPVPNKHFPIDPLKKISKKTTAEKPTTKKTTTNKLPLSSGHFNLLWLIKNLADKSIYEIPTIEGMKPAVELPELQKVFFWYTDNTLYYLRRLENMLADLKRTGHISFEKIVINYYYLSNKGLKLFEKNRNERKKQIEKFFIEVNLPQADCNNIINRFEEITPLLWKKILSESKGIKIPQDPKGKKV